MSTPPDPRDSALVETTSKVLVALISAHERGDFPEIAKLIGSLLSAVATYTGTPKVKRDAALLRAIGR